MGASEGKAKLRGFAEDPDVRELFAQIERDTVKEFALGDGSLEQMTEARVTLKVLYKLTKIVGLK